MYLLTDLTDKLKKKMCSSNYCWSALYIEYVYTDVYIGVDFIF